MKWMCFAGYFPGKGGVSYSEILFCNIVVQGGVHAAGSQTIGDGPEAQLPEGAAEGEAHQGQGGHGDAALTLSQTLRVPGVRSVMAAFFCYCALEQTAILWSSSYLHLHRGVPAERRRPGPEP